MTPGGVGKQGSHMERWADYVTRHVGDRNQVDVAVKAGISQSTLSRWAQDKVQPSLESAIAFARACDANPIEALVLLGALNLKDFEDSGLIQLQPGVREISDQQLAAEVRRRLMDVKNQ